MIRTRKHWFKWSKKAQQKRDIHFKNKERKDRQNLGREEENVDRLSSESQSDCCLLSDEMGNTVSTAGVIAFYFMFIFK